MTTSLRYAALLLVVSLLPSLLTAQEVWEPVPGPYGMNSSDVLTVRFHGTLYMMPFNAFSIKAQSLYWTEDKGDSWHRVDRSLPAYAEKLWVDSVGALIILVRDTSVVKRYRWLRSEDRGATWSTLHTAYGNVNAFGFLVLADGSYLLASSAPPIRKSTDFGRTWIDLPEVAPIDSFANGCHLALQPGGRVLADFRVPSIPGSSYTQFWESLDSGRTWGPRNGREVYHYLFVNDSVYFTIEYGGCAMQFSLCGHDQGSLECTNQQFTWNGSGSGFEWMASDRSGALYFILRSASQGRSTVVRSFDSGRTWDTLSVPAGYAQFHLATVDSSLLLFGPSGPIRSDDRGVTWREANIGIDLSPSFHAFQPLPDGSVLYTTLLGALYRYNRSDRSMTRIATPDNRRMSTSMAESRDGSLYSFPLREGAATASINEIVRLNRGEATFVDIPDFSGSKEQSSPQPLAGSDTVRFLTTYTDNDVDLVIADRNQVGLAAYDTRRSTWYRIDTMVKGSQPPAYLHYPFGTTREGYLFAVSRLSTHLSLHRFPLREVSGPNAESVRWEKVFDAEVSDSRYWGDHLRFNTAGERGVMMFADDSLFVTLDNGMTWRSFGWHNGYGGGYLTSGGTLYGVTNSSQITRIDAGSTELHGVNIGVNRLRMVVFKESAEGDLYALINDSILYRRTFTTAVHDVGRDNAARLTLVVAPNPTADELVVTFRASARDRCSVRLFDLAGRSVLQSQEIESGGRIVFDVGHLPVGSYRCEVTSLTTGERTSSAVQVVR